MGGAPLCALPFFVPMLFVCAMSGFCMFRSHWSSMLAFDSIPPAVPSFLAKPGCGFHADFSVLRNLLIINVLPIPL